MPEVITSVVSNPKVAYRLDPDEPGMARPASATNSVYTVVAQESHNRARLKSEALLRGDDVLLVKTDYKVARAGSFNVVVGGLTTVVTRGRPDDAGTQQGRFPQVGGHARPDSDPLQVAQLNAEQESLERERSDLTNGETDQAAYEVSGNKARVIAIDRRLGEIRAELRKLGVSTAAGNLSPATAFAVNGFFAALDATGKLLDVIA